MQKYFSLSDYMFITATELHYYNFKLLLYKAKTESRMLKRIKVAYNQQQS